MSIGTSCCVVMALLGLFVILLDLNKLHADCKIGRDNVKHFINKKSNKVSDSNALITAEDSAGM